MGVLKSQRTLETPFSLLRGKGGNMNNICTASMCLLSQKSLKNPQGT
jgi:hypothetical protein